MSSLDAYDALEHLARTLGILGIGHAIDEFNDSFLGCLHIPSANTGGHLSIVCDLESHPTNPWALCRHILAENEQDLYINEPSELANFTERTPTGTLALAIQNHLDYHPAPPLPPRTALPAITGKPNAPAASSAKSAAAAANENQEA